MIHLDTMCSMLRLLAFSSLFLFIRPSDDLFDPGVFSVVSGARGSFCCRVFLVKSRLCERKQAVHKSQELVSHVHMKPAYHNVDFPF